MLYEYGKRTRDCFEAFLFFFLSLVCYSFGAFLIKQLLVPLALVGYEMIIAPRWLSTISYPTRATRLGNYC